MEATQGRTGQPERTGDRHKTLALERGTSGNQGERKGYAARCDTCGAVTFGGFANKTLAKAALEHARG